MGKSLERLASGKRINRSADDASGLSLAEAMRAKITTLDAAKRNANDGISYLQVAEGGLGEIANSLVRMRELTSQAATDTIGQRERSMINKEFVALRDEVDRQMKTTEFNGSKVLQPESVDVPIQMFVGVSNRGDDIDGNAPDIDTENDPDVIRLELSDLQNMVEKMDAITSEGLFLVESDGDNNATSLGPDGTSDVFNKIDNAINGIANYRATIGSVQSRLTSAISTIDVTGENLKAAKSRVEDIDFATETAELTQSRILSQAGISVLTQANQVPEMALSLLR